MSELQNRSSDDSATTVQISPPDIVRRWVTAWGSVRAEVIEFIKRDQFEYKFHAPHHLLIMSERTSRDDGETLVDGLPISTARVFGRKLILVPAGHELQGWQKPGAPTRVTYFYIDPHSTLLGSEGRLADVDLRPRLFFFDSDLWETTAKLKAQAEHQVIGQRTYAEALCVVLVHELVRVNSGAAGDNHLRRGGLAGWQKRQVRDYIEEHLDDNNISLAKLAGLTRLSPFHFARAFKQSFELPPRRYLTLRRIERAKELLSQPDLSVTRIGVNVGFGDTSSFSAAFRRETGVTPTNFRRVLV
jgi:AraC family transcriptional regulator